MENVKKRQEELQKLMEEYEPSVQRAWVQIAKLEGNNSLRSNEKIGKIKDVIMQEVANDN